MYTVTEFEQKTAEYLKQWEMLSAEQSVIVACSGGADSIALLFCLKRLGIPVSAVHINHRLRGQESDKEEAFVREICEKNQISLDVFYARECNEPFPETGQELWAREKRYSIFESLFKEGKNRIATAHNANDQAETLLFRLIQGTGSKGASGIPPVRDFYIRPLLWANRKEIEQYCEQIGCNYVIDSSNLSNCYSRNKIRNQVLPLLLEMNPATIEHLSEYCHEMRSIEEYVALEGEKLLQVAKREYGWSVKVLLQAPVAIADKAFSLLCSQKVAPNRKRVQSIRRLACIGGRISLKKGIKLAKFQDLLVWEDTTQYYPQDQVTALQSGYFYENSEFSVEIWCESCETKKKNTKFKKKVLNSYADCDKIPNDIVLRTMRPGDRIRPKAGGVSKSLRKFYQEQKIPPFFRDKLPILASDQRVIWVWGYGFIEEFRVENANKPLWIWSFCGQKKEKENDSEPEYER